MVYTMVLQKSVRINEKSGGFFGVPWNIPPCKRTFEARLHLGKRENEDITNKEQWKCVKTIIINALPSLSSRARPLKADFGGGGSHFLHPPFPNFRLSAGGPFFGVRSAAAASTYIHIDCIKHSMGWVDR
jgi:hypothetical protein